MCRVQSIKSTGRTTPSTASLCICRRCFYRRNQGWFRAALCGTLSTDFVAQPRIRDSVFQTFDQTFAVTYALQLIAVIVAAIGIFDTLIALLLERGRELATLRAVGASSTQIQKMTFIEFGLIGIFAWFIGSVAGICLAWQLITVINRQFFGWTIQMTLPPQVFAQALALALLAAIGSGILPARAAARRNIAEALQLE
jgi:putative ABC transport system permease protein